MSLDTFVVQSNEEDLIMLESLIKSPAFGALKRAVAQYRSTIETVLHTTGDTHKLYQAQGICIGLGVVANLPALLVSEREQKKKRAEELAKPFKPRGPQPGPKKV